ncbi:MAG: translation initiation factor IF-3 [Candidatus Thorarchaeota archaeon]|jgi:translation initiation factor IF-3
MKKKKKDTQQKYPHRVNEKIRFSPIRVVAENGDQLGEMPTVHAKTLALDAGLDLVEVAPNARPPVCRIMDYSKFKYDQSLKDKKQRKSKKAQLKEVRLSPDIASHDVDTKTAQAKKHLEAGHPVQLKLRYKGRENAHKDLGFDVVNRMVENLAEVSKVSREPKIEGRVLHCLLEPV